MYLIDDYDNPITETGYYEDREPEFYGTDPNEPIEPTISNGDWGWLCSAYAPVYKEDGTLVCHIGCDIQMEDIMAERRANLSYVLFGAIGLTVVVLIGAVLFANKFVISPLNSITMEMKKFKPAENISYEEAGVIDLDIKTRDEIMDIYNGIKTMQINIIDFLNDLYKMQKDKERAENDIRDKEKQIDRISMDAYRDSLTSVGNKAAYIKKTEALKEEIENGDAKFAIVMIDINELKRINDTYGHNAGDSYIKGCCHMICDVFKHSPVFRIGGDEFIVILQGEDYKYRRKNFEMLRNDFERTYSNTSAEPWERFSAASGMAEYASDNNTVDLVFKHADRAMYKDKMLFKEKHGIKR